MATWQVVGLLLLGVGLLIASLLLRVSSEGRYEIKTIDLAFIVVPLLFVGVATGKLSGLDLFGVKADLSDLWAKAADMEIEEQVSKDPASSLEDAVEMVEVAPKRSVEDIPRLIEQRTQALSFRLGMGGYYGPAVKRYFDDLYGSSYLRYVVINETDGRLFGMYEAADLIAYLRTSGESGYERFEEMLNEGGPRSRDFLARLPGFVPAERAVTVRTSKRAALQAMEAQGVPSLPVVDRDGRFLGTVERSKLTASLILAVTEKLSGDGGSG